MAIRVAFIGAGGINRRHMDRVALVDGAEVVAVCDPQQDRTALAVKAHGCKAFTDWRAMFDEVAFDALYIAVPPHAHEGQEELAASKGIHVIVEKPIANRLDRAQDIEGALLKAGVVAAAGYQWRYRADLAHVRERFDPAKLAMAKGYWCGGFPGVAWWRRRDQSGGQFVEQATHLVDLARYLVGEFDSVCAIFTNHTKHDIEAFDIWDAGAVAARFQNGATALFCTTCALPLNYTVALHLLTSDDVIEIDQSCVKFLEPGKTTEFAAGDDAYLTQAKAFIDAIRGDRSAIRSTYSDAVKTLRFTLAATEAATTGETIRLS